jgi:hypothetical protein
MESVSQVLNFKVSMLQVTETVPYRDMEIILLLTGTALLYSEVI